MKNMMTNIKNQLRKSTVVSTTVLFVRVFLQKWQEAMLCTKHLATSGRYSSSIKLKQEIDIMTHALEKGMSIGKVKQGFGQQKALTLIDRLESLSQMHDNEDVVRQTLATSCSVLKRYVEFNEERGADMSRVNGLVDGFSNEHNVLIQDMGGVLTKRFDNTKETLRKDFSVFSQSRFSVRDFGDTPISRERIERALKLCERTPSACNRQSWRIHVFLDKEECNKLFRLQGGTKGFYEDMQCAILVCSDLRSYNFYEYSLPYVDGSLYAMNLLYALHYEGLATIPLTLGRKNGELRKIKRAMEIPENEVPVILIGVGSYKEEYRVAESHRLSYKEYTTIR